MTVIKSFNYEVATGITDGFLEMSEELKSSLFYMQEGAAPLGWKFFCDFCDHLQHMVK